MRWISPNAVEGVKEHSALGGVNAADEVECVVAPFATQVYGCEAIQRHIGHTVGLRGNIKKALYGITGGIGLESCLGPYPVGAFNGDCLLGQLIAEFQLEIGSIETAFTGQTGNIELALCFWLVLGCEGGRCEKKTEFFDLGKLSLQLPVSIDGEAGCRDGDFCSRRQFLLQIIFDEGGYVVEYRHEVIPCDDFSVFLYVQVHRVRPAECP